nr:hypothetical protein [Tanacetum cinerariifolium]
MKEKEERSSKRYKSSGESSFNTRDSGDGSFNLNRTVEDEEDEVWKVRRSRPIGRDQAKRKAKAMTSSAENDRVIADQKARAETQGCRAGNPRLENRQRDEALYLSTTDEELKRIQVLDTAYWGFIGVRTTLDIFQNIIFILYFQYGVWSSGYGVLSFIPSWSLVSAGTDTPYLP